MEDKTMDTLFSWIFYFLASGIGTLILYAVIKGAVYSAIKKAKDHELF